MNKIGKNCNISKFALIEDNVKIGDNVFIGPFTVIRPNVEIGNNTEIRASCFVAEGAIIGNNVKIIQLSNIVKRAVIEDNVFIGTGVLLVDTNRISHSRSYKPVGNPPIIKYGARIASGVVVLPGVVVEKNCLIGAGSVLTKSTIENGKYIGSPAVWVGEVPKNERL